MDWLAGLGEGFKGIGPAIQMLLMLQQAKQEASQRQQFHTEDINAANTRAQADRDQQMRLANMEGERLRRQDFLGPLQKQGIFPSSSDYTSAARIQAPAPTANIDPVRGAMSDAQGLAGAAGQSEDRLNQLRRGAADALQRANKAGPGAIEQFGQGGFAMSQQPYPTQSVSTSHSFAGVDPNQLNLQAMQIYAREMNNYIDRAVDEYRAIYGPWGGNEEQIRSQAQQDWERVWPSIMKQFFPNMNIQGGGATSQSTSTTVTGTPGMTPPPQVPQNQQQLDANTRANRYRSRLSRRP